MRRVYDSPVKAKRSKSRYNPARQKSVFLPEQTIAGVRSEAEIEERSFSKMLDFLVREALAAREEKRAIRAR